MDALVLTVTVTMGVGGGLHGLKASFYSSHLAVKHLCQFSARDTFNEISDGFFQIIQTMRIVSVDLIFQCTPQVKIRECKIR
jgi:hypothetical protein